MKLREELIVCASHTARKYQARPEWVTPPPRPTRPLKATLREEALLPLPPCPSIRSPESSVRTDAQCGSLPTAALLLAQPNSCPPPHPTALTMPTASPSQGPPLALSDLSGLPASLLYLPPCRLAAADKIPRSQFRAHHLLPDTPMNMGHKCLPSHEPAQPALYPQVPPPAVNTSHVPSSVLSPSYALLHYLELVTMPGRSECCHSQHADLQQGTYLIRNKNLVHFRKPADPLFRYCKFRAGLSLLSAHLTSKHPDAPTKAECGVGTTFTPHQHPRPRRPPKAWCLPLACLCCPLV